MVNEINIDDYSPWITFESSARVADELEIYSTCIDGTISCFDSVDQEQVPGTDFMVFYSG
jgi:hypothetical protein